MVELVSVQSTCQLDLFKNLIWFYGTQNIVGYGTQNIVGYGTQNIVGYLMPNPFLYI